MSTAITLILALPLHVRNILFPSFCIFSFCFYFFLFGPDRYLIFFFLIDFLTHYFFFSLLNIQIHFFSAPRGLLVPVVRNVESMSMLNIEATIAELGAKARNDQIAMEDMAGGTFTISNGGVFGSMMGTPIINLPQSAVLGMHSIKQRPTVVNGEIVARPIMYIALTYDHRLVDGREAVTFLCSVRDKVEDPRRLLLGL